MSDAIKVPSEPIGEPKLDGLRRMWLVLIFKRNGEPYGWHHFHPNKAAADAKREELERDLPGSVRVVVAPYDMAEVGVEIGDVDAEVRFPAMAGLGGVR